MRSKNILSILCIIYFLAGCAYSNQPTQTASADTDPDADYVYGINTASDNNPDSLTVFQTTGRIRAVPDEFVVADSTITSRISGKTVTFHLFYPWRLTSKKKEILKCSDVLIPALSHKTSTALKETILKSIAKKEGLYEIDLYCSMSAFYEQVKNDMPKTPAEINQKSKIIANGFIGNLYHGKYYEYKPSTAHYSN